MMQKSYALESGFQCTSTPGELDDEPASFNQSVFEELADALGGEAVAKYLDTILSLCQDVASSMTADRNLPRNRELADRSHKLAGCAGLFGFERLTALSKQVEYEIETSSPDLKLTCEALGKSILSANQKINLIKISMLVSPK